MAQVFACEENLSLGCAGGKRGERIAQQPAVRALVVGMAAVKMNEPAPLVDVLDRMLQRRLPAGKQHDSEKKSI